MMEMMELIGALLIVIGATIIILNLGGLSAKSPFSVSSLEYINTQAKYQALLFGVAIFVLISVYFVNPDNFLMFFSFWDY